MPSLSPFLPPDLSFHSYSPYSVTVPYTKFLSQSQWAPAFICFPATYPSLSFFQLVIALHLYPSSLSDLTTIPQALLPCLLAPSIPCLPIFQFLQKSHSLSLSQNVAHPKKSKNLHSFKSQSLPQQSASCSFPHPLFFTVDSLKPSTLLPIPFPVWFLSYLYS